MKTQTQTIIQYPHDITDQEAILRSQEKVARWWRKHHGHNVIRESATTVHCVNCQAFLEHRS